MHTICYIAQLFVCFYAASKSPYSSPDTSIEAEFLHNKRQKKDNTAGFQSGRQTHENLHQKRKQGPIQEAYANNNDATPSRKKNKATFHSDRLTHENVCQKRKQSDIQQADGDSNAAALSHTG